MREMDPRLVKFQVLAPNREAPLLLQKGRPNKPRIHIKDLDGQVNHRKAMGFQSYVCFLVGSMWGLHSKWTADQHVRAFPFKMDC